MNATKNIAVYEDDEIDEDALEVDRRPLVAAILDDHAAIGFRLVGVSGHEPRRAFFFSGEAP